MLEARKLPIELTGMEVVFLSDAISNSDKAEGLPDKDAHVPLARDTLLLLGSLFCEMVGPAGVQDITGTIWITQEQAWLFRSKVKTGDIGIDKQPLGVPLLLKLYSMLSQFNSGLEDFDTDYAEPDASEAMGKLVYLKEYLNASDRAGNDPGPYIGA